VQPASSPEFSRLSPPYHQLSPTDDPRAFTNGRAYTAGEALAWHVREPVTEARLELVRGRPGGVALLVLLPPSDRLVDPETVLRLVERCRPHSILPHHVEPRVADLTAILRRPPDDLAREVVDYLVWRGLRVDGDTRHLIRRIVDLAGDLRTVSGLSRSLYLSRRALGRRFMSRELPVPSHWLHMGRILKAAIRLQNCDASLFDVAGDLGYADGFSLSNQMHRLVGVRPAEVRECLGWEWILEAWLRKEAVHGGLTGAHSAGFHARVVRSAPAAPTRQEPPAARIGRAGERRRARAGERV